VPVVDARPRIAGPPRQGPVGPPGLLLFAERPQGTGGGVDLDVLFLGCPPLERMRAGLSRPHVLARRAVRRGRAFYRDNYLYTHPALAGRYVLQFVVPDESDNATRGTSR
jgi:hypothetical protein